MYVCICKAVTDKQIKQAVADGANSLRAVRQQTGAMSQCGKCACLAKQVLDESLEEQHPINSGLFFAATC